MKSENYTVCPHCNKKIDEKDIKMIMVISFTKGEINSQKNWDLLRPEYEVCQKCEHHALGLGCTLDDIFECPYKRNGGDN